MNFTNRLRVRTAPIVGISSLVTLAAGVNAAPIDSSTFQSCPQAREVVARAGSNGVRIDRRPDPIYSDPGCFRGYLSTNKGLFKEKVKINGKWCVIGYSCIRMPSPP
jgi:hypothetical protein